VTTLSKRKLSFQSKHNIVVTLFQNMHTTTHALSFATLLFAPLATSRGFACNCRALVLLRCCTPLLPPFYLYIKKKTQSICTSTSQPAFGTGYQPVFCGLKRGGPTRFFTPNIKCYLCEKCHALSNGVFKDRNSYIVTGDQASVSLSSDSGASKLPTTRVPVNSLPTFVPTTAPVTVPFIPCDSDSITL